MNKKEEEIYKRIIKSNFIMSLATTDNNLPSACTTFYVTDDNINFYFKSRTESNHSKTLSTNNLAAITIYEPKSNYSTKAGIQGQGTVSRVRDIAEMTKVISLYGKSFIGSEKKFSSIQDLISDFVKSTMYKFTIEKVKIVDSSEGIHSLEYLKIQN